MEEEKAPFCIHCKIFCNVGECPKCHRTVHDLEYYVKHNILPENYFELSLEKRKETDINNKNKE